MLSVIPLDIIGLISEYLYFKDDRNNFKVLCKHVYRGFKKGKRRDYVVEVSQYSDNQDAFIATYLKSNDVSVHWSCFSPNCWYVGDESEFEQEEEFLEYVKIRYSDYYHQICFMMDLIKERKLEILWKKNEHTIQQITEHKKEILLYWKENCMDYEYDNDKCLKYAKTNYPEYYQEICLINQFIKENKDNNNKRIKLN